MVQSAGSVSESKKTVKRKVSDFRILLSSNVRSGLTVFAPSVSLCCRLQRSDDSHGSGDSERLDSVDLREHVQSPSPSGASPSSASSEPVIVAEPVTSALGPVVVAASKRRRFAVSRMDL